jgi:hypothetical protein
MKIHIVRDAKGKVIASAEVARGKEVPLKPELAKGQETEEVEAAENYTEALGDFYKKLAKPK